MYRRNLSYYLVIVVVLFFIALTISGQSTEAIKSQSPEVHHKKSPVPATSDGKQASQESAQAKSPRNNSGKSDTRKKTKESKSKQDEASESNVAPAISLKEKEQLSESILAGVLSSAFLIEPVEYSIIAQVEGASLLWEKDRERANEELIRAWTRLRELLVEKKGSSSTESAVRKSEIERSRLRQAILRRIAKLSPDLIRDLTEAGASNDKTKSAIASEADVGTAIVAIAVEEIKNDPKLAMRLAEQGLSYGAVYPASTFLTHLWFQDKQLAEKQALVYLNTLPLESVSNLWLVTKIYSFLAPPMRERYFESLAVRLRLGLRPDLNVGEYRDLLSAARKGAMQAASYPAWNEEFARLVNEVEALMASRSISSPVSPPARAISMSGMSPATPGDTAEIEHSAQKLDTFRNQKIKDSEYQRLAIEAAEKADATLAERLLSKISDENARRQTSIHVYGPLVNKSLGEKDWQQAKSYALKVTDPLGLSLIVDSVAKAMLSAKQDKQMVKSFYEAALLNLDRETPSLYVAKGIITLAKSRLPEEPEGGFTTTSLAVSVLNRSDISEPYSSRSGVTKGLDPWVTQTNLILGVDDYFDVTETIGPLFKDLSRHNFARAQELSLSFSHPGLRSLAQLGIIRGIQEEIKEVKRAQKGNQASPEK
jgi:hypothetical protein